MDDLITWLRAVQDARLRQLDDDDRVARTATAGPWRYDPTKHHRLPGTARFEEGLFTGPPAADAVCVAVTGETDDRQSMADAAHIARWDPARVLEEIAFERADIEAKRRILDEHTPAVPSDPAYGCPTCWFGAEDGRPEDSPCVTVLLLALPYAGYPGWREEWAL